MGWFNPFEGGGGNAKSVAAENITVGALADGMTATTQSDNDNSDKLATTAYVDKAIDNLPEPMVFQGSVGQDGTITELPDASAANLGYVYKVITDGASGPGSKKGDTVISNGTTWVLIPSGDEPSGTVTEVAAGAGLITDQVLGGAITESGVIKANLASETALTGEKVYNVGVNNEGQLAVKVPWENEVEISETEPTDSEVELWVDLSETTTIHIPTIKDDTTSEEELWSSSKVSEELDKKVDKVSGKQLSTNDYTTAEKTKLSGIAEGATRVIIDSALSETSTNPVENRVINSAISSLNTSISNEVSRATTAEGSLQTNINNEATRAQGIESGLQTSIDEEVARAKGVETTLETSISNEVSRATEVESALQADLESLKNYTGYESTEVLGVQIDYANKTSTRLAGAANLTAGADFNQFSIYGGRKRCNVADDGAINAYYGDSTYVEDGSNGQVMVYQPKFYYKVVPLKLEKISDGQGYHIRKANYYISAAPRNGFRLHPAFIGPDNVEYDNYLTGAYEASLYDTSESTYILDDAQVADFAADKICSIANAKPMSGLTQNLNRANCDKLATNRGSNWHNTTLAIESAEQLLMMVEFGTMNFQDALGKGVTDLASGSGNESLVTGSTSSLGNASGKAEGIEGKSSVSYRGRENPYGNIWAFVQGLTIWGDGNQKSGLPYVSKDFAFAENTLDNYESVGFTTAGVNGYISAMGYGNPEYDWVFLASETSGNSTVPVGDYQYYTTNLNGYRVGLLGGAWNVGFQAGSFDWALDASPSARYRHVGGRAATWSGNTN